MKKSSLLFLFFALCFSGLKSQNTYDMYNTKCGLYPAIDPASGFSISAGGFGSYIGEYQIFLNDHPWENYGGAGTFNNNAISYKIEAVSFPFTPNCINCQTFFIGAEALDPTKRVMKMPDDKFPYDASQKA